MKANELRIGNWVIDNDDDDRIIKINDGEDICYSKFYSPIPLTEEILLKCGFERDKILGSYILNHFRFHSQRPCNDYKKFTLVTEMYFAENRILVIGGMKYLHQLQNLYFALTNEELNIEL